MIEAIPGKGNKAAFKSLRSLKKNTQKGVSSAWLNTGRDVVKTAKNLMSEKKSGKIYTVYWSKSGKRLSKGRKHRASAMGQAPGIVSGELYRSLGFNRNSFHSLEIGSSAKHSQWLESSPDGSWSGYLNRNFLYKSITLKSRDTQNYLKDDICRSLSRKHR